MDLPWSYPFQRKHESAKKKIEWGGAAEGLGCKGLWGGRSFEEEVYSTVTKKKRIHKGDTQYLRKEGGYLLLSGRTEGEG